jgi:hypothetical protein
MEPSCLLGLANSHLLLESCAEGLEIRFEKTDVPAHHAEMGNLLSLYPKIHRLDTDPEVGSRLSNVQGEFLASKSETWRPFVRGRDLGEVLSHVLLYGMF